MTPSCRGDVEKNVEKNLKACAEKSLQPFRLVKNFLDMIPKA